MQKSNNQQTSNLSDTEWISNLSKDDMLNFAIVKIINEDELTAQRLHMRVRTLEALMSDILANDYDYIALKDDWEKTVKETSKEEQLQKRIMAEYEKLDTLILRLSARVPQKTQSTMLDNKEIEHLREFMEHKDEIKEFIKQREEQEKEQTKEDGQTDV